MCSHCGRTGTTTYASGYRSVCEGDLPLCVRDVLRAARASRPESEVSCLAFRTFDDGEDIVRLGPSPQLLDEWNPASVLGRLPPKELLVISVAVAETTFERVRKVTHVLVARVRRATRHHAAQG
jgi:hypothetical protein